MVERKCQETTGAIGNLYLRCGKPAVAVVQHRGRSEGPYDLCEACADHNVRNRNGYVVEQYAPSEIVQRLSREVRP
jgi:hypothetical protein